MYKQLFDAVDVGLVTFDRDYKIIDWNRWLENQTETERKDAIGRSLTEICPNLQSPWFKRNVRSVLKFGSYSFFSQKIHGYCIPIERKYTVSQEFRYMQQNCTLGPIRDETGQISGLFLSIQDVTELAIFEHKLSEVAKRDGLTGVYNRGCFDTQIAAEFDREQRYNRNLSLALLDVDHFKSVNDTYGHQAGDEILKQLGNLVDTNIRTADFLARFGGEEFAILLPETDLAPAWRVAEKIRTLVESTVFSCFGNAIKITISIGVSTNADSMFSHNDLVASADRALYSAKAEGRNRVNFDTKTIDTPTSCLLRNASKITENSNS